MYRVLVVDDEPIIADGLYDELMFVESLDLDVYKAYSARAALELLAKHRIDVVVTDIRMPGMDGMALMERIRDSWPECRVIFLTGHREFDYVYKAIQYRGLQYVLKTEGYGKVLAAVQAAIDEIGRESALNGQLDELRRRMDTAAMFLQKDFLMHLLAHGAAPSGQDLGECRIGLNADEQLFLVAGRLNLPQHANAYAEAVKAVQAVRLVAEQFLSPQLLVACIPGEQQDVALLAQPKKLPGRGDLAGWDAAWQGAELFLRETLELMQGSIRAVLGCSVSFSMQSGPVGWSGMLKAYESVRRMLDFQIGAGVETLLTEEAIADLQNIDQDKRASTILKRLSAYIDGHLAEDLSLIKLSELMYFNPSYLSRLFKQLSGKNLTDYIQEKRIERARQLLEIHENRINDISAMVGFGSGTNFTRFFKKATGMTPQEYRERLSESKAGIQM